MAFAIGCGNDSKNTADDETGTAGTETAGDGDGDPTGDGDGDPTGDGDGDPTGDGDGDPTGDGDGDPNCDIGAEGCPCTPGGGCDPGLTCDLGVCTPDDPTGDGDGDPGDGDGDPGDGDGDPGDGDGDSNVPYGPCPSGDNADCAEGELCITGNANNTPWSMCTPGQCMGGMDCDTIPDDVCADAPGDMMFIQYCLPQTCNQNNPCPDGMQCFPGFNNQPSVCLWPNN